MKRLGNNTPRPANVPVYAVIGVWFQGEANATLLAVNDRIVIFDTPQMARDYLPRLGGGRQTVWSDDDTACWALLTTTGINRAVVLWNYDPYDAPHGRSESRLHEWRHHIVWQLALTHVGMEEKSDGTHHNPNIGELLDKKRAALRDVIVRG